MAESDEEGFVVPPLSDGDSDDAGVFADNPSDSDAPVGHVGRQGRPRRPIETGRFGLWILAQGPRPASIEAALSRLDEPLAIRSVAAHMWIA